MENLRQQQADYDKKYFDRGYLELDSKDSKIEHIGSHLGKLLGIKAFHWLTGEWEDSKKRRVVLEEVIPDLSIYRTQLANVTKLDDEVLEIAGNSVRDQLLKPTKLAIYARVAKARGLIDTYCEPRRHSLSSRDAWMPQRATLYLHEALAGIEYQYGLTTDAITSMHQARLEANIERFTSHETAPAVSEEVEIHQNLSTR